MPRPQPGLFPGPPMSRAEQTATFAARSLIGRVATARYTGPSNITHQSTAGFTEIVGPGTLTVPAVVGDMLSMSLSGFYNNEATQLYIDAVTIVGGTPTNYFSTGGSTPAGSGVMGWRALQSVQGNISGSATYLVQAGDIVNGAVTVALYAKTNAALAKTIYASANDVFQRTLVNLGKA